MLDEKLKNSLIESDLERGEIRSELQLWYYLPVIDAITESLANAPGKKIDTVAVSAGADCGGGVAAGEGSGTAAAG